jgi:elongation factor P
MISSNDFRSGVTIELDGSVWRVVEFLHVKPGKGSAFVRTKLKNAQTGSVIEKTFRAGESVPQASLEKLTMQYTYKDGDQYVFMDMETFDEVRLNPDQLGDRVKFLKEEMSVNILFWNETVLDVELPNTIVLEITETDPGLKGELNPRSWKRVPRSWFRCLSLSENGSRLIPGMVPISVANKVRQQKSWVLSWDCPLVVGVSD